MNLKICVLAVILILSTVYGQTSEPVNQIVDGPCSRFTSSTQQPFFKKLFTGTWYVYASYDYKEILGLDCLIVNYQLALDGHVSVIESGKTLTTNVRSTFPSDYYFTRPGVGQYIFGQESLDIPVIDYMHYYIEFSCVDLAAGKSDCYIGLFTRLPFPSAFVVNRLNEYLNAHNIDRTKLRYINHDKTKCTL